MTAIFLTGFMGCGKSSVGRMLAVQLHGTFVDLDEVISDAAGATIKEIFAAHGEAAFRAMEQQALQNLQYDADVVVSTGGGAVIADGNRSLMRAKGVIINLTASAETIIERLAADTERPLLQNDNSIEKIGGMLKAREDYYADADVRIDTSGKTLEAIVQEILLWLKKDQILDYHPSWTR